MTVRATWQNELEWNVFGTVTALGAVVLGALGLTLGDDISQGMTNSLADHASVIAHLWGAALSGGGVLKLAGLYARRSDVEVPGLWVMSGGFAFYAITVVTGLGMHGLAAGVLSTAAAVGCLLKATFVMRRARRAARAHDRGHEPR